MLGLRGLIPERARLDPPRRDPAPSRWAYRLNRLWLRPGLRRTVRFGTPGLIGVLALAAWLASPERRAEIVAVYEGLHDEFRNRPEFVVQLVAIEGASPVLADSIRATLDLDLPLSSFEIDLDARRRNVEAFDAVERADLRIQPGGILRVSVLERLPALVWRNGDGLWLVDADGHQVAAITTRGLRPDLPLIVGDGANHNTSEAFDILRATGPLAPRVRGLVRVANHRWDLVLDADQRILLPTETPVQALRGLLALDAARGILTRDISAVDLRHPHRPTLRLRPDAREALEGLRLVSNGGSRQ